MPRIRVYVCGIHQQFKIIIVNSFLWPVPFLQWRRKVSCALLTNKSKTHGHACQDMWNSIISYLFKKLFIYTMNDNFKKRAQVLESKKLGSESRIYHWSVSQHWVTYSIFPNLSDPICKMGIIIWTSKHSWGDWMC